MATFTRSRPAKASIAADPVSPGSGADDRDALIAFGEHVLEQPPEQLHRHVLEGERRAVEQLLYPEPRLQLHERSDRGMVEAGVGVPAHRLEGAKGNGRADEGLDQPRREFRIRQAAHGPPVAGREVRPGLGNVEPAIFGEPRQQHAAEIAHGRLPASGYVAHEATVSRSQLVSKAGTGQQGRISSARP